MEKFILKVLGPVARALERFQRFTLIGQSQRRAYKAIFHTDERTKTAYTIGIGVGILICLTLMLGFGAATLILAVVINSQGPALPVPNLMIVTWIISSLVFSLTLLYLSTNFLCGRYANRLENTEQHDPEWRRSMPSFEVDKKD